MCFLSGIQHVWALAPSESQTDSANAQWEPSVTHVTLSLTRNGQKESDFATATIAIVNIF